MSPVALSNFVALAVAAALVSAQDPASTFPATPLASKHFAYPTGLPYQADTEPHLIRGGQLGYNICNSTTEGPSSLCQTSFLNSLDDFCLWAPPEPNSDVGSHEGEMVAWCTKPGRGTRLIPEGTLKGVQFMRTSDYVQVVGYIDQTHLNMPGDDFGGELDPHGADLRGNPLGGLFYSNAFSGNNNTFDQVIEWHNFIGGNFFCLKACDAKGAHAADYCQHIYDRIGCTYNAPNNAQNNVFEACEGDNQDFPGIYTENGVVMTYSQPPESLGPISSMPYQPKVPASSNCHPFQSSELYAAIATVHATNAAATPTTTGGSTGAGAGSSKPTGSASASRTGSAAGANSTGNSASTVGFSTVALVGAVFSALFLS